MELRDIVDDFLGDILEWLQNLFQALAALVAQNL